MSHHLPHRTCIGCRKVSSMRDLVRWVVAAGEGHKTLTLDHDRRLPGRGAWVHLHPTCVTQAVNRRSFPRALRYAGPIDMTEIHTWLEASVVDQESGFEADGPPMSPQR